MWTSLSLADNTCDKEVAMAARKMVDLTAFTVPGGGPLTDSLDILCSRCQELRAMCSYTACTSSSNSCSLSSRRRR